MQNRQRYVLIAFIIGAAIAEAIGGWLTALSVKTWYPLLNKPTWTPPDYVFGPVWTVLYLAMAIALWLIWKAPVAKSKMPAYAFFAIQLFLNVIWSGFFFGMKNPALALIDIGLLWITIVVTIAQFWPISRVASYLLLPYLLWVTYAAALNAAIWSLN